MNKKNFVPLISKNDKKIVLDLINEYQIEIKNLYIQIGNKEYISGIFGDKDDDVNNYFKYNHFIESINDLSQKTKISIEKCLTAYQKVDSEKFNPMTNNLSNYEKKAYYYMENALFREIILWESLAQLYNVYFCLKINIERVNYKKIIDILSKRNEKIINFKKISMYINEKYDIKKPVLDEGIHDFVCQLRNQMTHRYSIAITSMSENINLRAMPDSIYKIAKDYNMVQKHLVEIINIIIDNILKKNVIDKIESKL